jgi:pimeloyl-ACP methyl ester carboxylesterase
MFTWIFYSLLAIALLVILLCAAIWMLGVKSQSPSRNKELQAAPPMPYESISFPSGGLTVRGWFIPAKKASVKDAVAAAPPVVIIVHGWGSNRSRVLRYTEPLYEAGYALLLFDARAHGESDPFPTPSGIMFRDDVLAAINYTLTRTDIDPARIAVLSYSLGAFGSTLALEHTSQIKVMVTDSMPTRMETMITSELKRLKLPLFPLAYFIPKIWYYRTGVSTEEVRKLDIVQILNRTATPMLMIHSRQDDYIPSAELDYVLTHVKPRRIEHLFVQSPGHRSSETDPDFFKTVMPFLNKHLK